MEAGAATLQPREWSTARRAVVALAGWAALIAVGYAWGEALNDHGVPILIGAPPLAGRFDPELEPQGIATLAAALVIIWSAPILTARLSWRWLLLACFIGAWAWAGALDF